MTTAAGRVCLSDTVDTVLSGVIDVISCCLERISLGSNHQSPGKMAVALSLKCDPVLLLLLLVGDQENGSAKRKSPAASINRIIIVKLENISISTHPGTSSQLLAFSFGRSVAHMILQAKPRSRSI